MNRAALVASGIAVSMVLLACAEKTFLGPAAEGAVRATVGAIEVSVATSGPDQDADGYILNVQAKQNASSSQSARLPVTGKFVVAGTQAGAVEVVLYGLASNCTLRGSNPRVLSVYSGETVAVSYAVDCVASGSLRITTITTGVDVDTDGYLMRDEDRSTIGSDISHSSTAGLDAVLPSNGTTVLQSLIPGSYSVAVRSVATNCNLATDAMQAITIVAGVETSLILPIACVAPTQIAFVRGAGRNDSEAVGEPKTDIYVVNSNGTGTRRLTSEPGADLNPAWSPDGQKIAFASDRDGNREIYVMNADGTAPVRLTRSSGKDYSPAYSPDGKRIVFVSERDGNAEIYIMDIDGTNVTRLTNDYIQDLEPAFAPDGRKIAFRRGGVGIYVMNPDGSGLTPLTNSRDVQPAWSPDGKTLAFIRDDRDIWLTNLDGSQLRHFLDSNYFRGNPEWSPNGKSIAFDDWDCWDSGPCPRGIVIATVAGQYSIEIDDASEPAWRPR